VEHEKRDRGTSLVNCSRIKAFGFVSKKKTLRASEKLGARVEAKTLEFLNEVKEVPPERLVFLDEAGFHLGMTRTHGRTSVGERLYSYQPRNVGSNISLIGAVRLSGICALHPYDGSIDGERFLDFLDSKLFPTLKYGDVVVLDNLRVHHIAAAKEMAKERGIRLLYLPPYSPELNPIEETWSIIKSVFRSMEARTISAFVDALCWARSAVTTDKIENLFKHAGYYHSC